MVDLVNELAGKVAIVTGGGFKKVALVTEPEAN